MNRFRSLAAILLAFVPVIAMAQKKTSTKPAAPKPGNATKAAAGDILPFKATEKTLAERPEGHRRADRVSQHRLAPDPGADGVAQRGRAGQVRVRPLLRAHDVPGHEGLPAGEVPGHPDPDGRAAERLHVRRLHQLPHDVLEGGPRDDAPGRGGPLHEPGLLARRRSRPRRGPCWASTTRTAPTRSFKLEESPARQGLHDPHLQAHHDGLPQGHRGHAEPVRVLAGPSSTAGTAPSTRP